jgi:outer membrane receptor for ferrienterochelin and colicins
MAQRHRRRTSLSRCTLSLALLGALSAPAFAHGDAAAPTTLDKVVVTAAGFEQKIADAPASISVISREELSKRPYTSLVDALRDVEGIYVGM